MNPFPNCLILPNLIIYIYNKEGLIGFMPAELVIVLMLN